MIRNDLKTLTHRMSTSWIFEKRFWATGCLMLCLTIIQAFAQDTLSWESEKFGPFDMQEIELTFNSDSHYYEGSTHIMFPYLTNSNTIGFFVFDGELIYNKVFDRFQHLYIYAQGLNVPIGTTGGVLYSLSVGYDYAPPSPPANPCGGKQPCCYAVCYTCPPTYLITGTATITAGQGIPTGIAQSVYPLSFDNEIVFNNSTNFTMAGKALVFGHETGDNGYLNYYDGIIHFRANVNYNAMFDTVTSMTFNSLHDISGTANGTLHTPELPVIGSRDIGNVEADIDENGFSGCIHIPVPGIPKKICTPGACVMSICTPKKCVPNPAYYTIPVNFKMTNTGEFSVFKKLERSKPWEFSAQQLAQIDDQGKGIVFMSNWRSIDISSTQGENQRFQVLPNADQVTTLEISEGLPAVIFRIGFTNENASEVSAILTFPDGTQWNLKDGLNAEFEENKGFSLWNPEGKDASFFVRNPEAGSYTITIQNGDELGDFSFEALAQNHLPNVDIKSVEPTDDSGVYRIEWIDYDPDDNAEVGIYLDTDRKGRDGRLVATIEEDHPDNVFLLDVNELDIPPDWYYVMLKIKDGVNPVDYEYALTPIHVANPNAPSPVTNIAVNAGDREFTLQWELVEDSDITQYEVLYTSIMEPDSFTPIRWLPSDVNKLTVTGLDNGYPVLVTVRAVNQAGLASEITTILQVVTQSATGRSHPVIISEPVTTAAVGETYIYFPQFFDADIHHFAKPLPNGETEYVDPYVWTLLEGPEGMVMDQGRFLLWTPTEAQLGEHNIVIQLTDQYALDGADEDHGGGIQEFTILAQEFYPITSQSQHPFEFLSYPNLIAFEGETYTYQPILNAAEDQVKFELIMGPEGMTISASGALEWTVPANAKGSKVFILATVDGEYKVEQEFFLGTITEANTLHSSIVDTWNQMK